MYVSRLITGIFLLTVLFICGLHYEIQLHVCNYYEPTGKNCVKKQWLSVQDKQTKY